MIVKMNFWDAKWDLDEAQCPCDIHFNDWIDAERLTGKTIYHFGTGKHHVVGLRQAGNGSNNAVFGITASFAHDKAEAVAAQLEQAGEVAFVGAFKTLLVYRKVG